MMRPLLNWLSPEGQEARLSILIFHRVLPSPDPLFPDEMHAERFCRTCGWLKGWFNVLPLREASRRLADGTLPARALSITFDDGYADNHDVALPILLEHGLSATFFVSTGFTDGGRMWNDTLIEAVRGATGDGLDLSALGLDGLGSVSLRTWQERRQAVDQLIKACRYLPMAQREAATQAVARKAGGKLPSALMMNRDQLRALHTQGMELGGHTVTHPILARLPIDEARTEISTGKLALESLLQSPVTSFAYPNGRPGEDYLQAHVDMVKELGFVAAVTTAWGVSRRSSDRHQLPRFTPWDRGRLAFGLRLAKNLV